MVQKIAITGGIGTGKTYISRLFVKMGIPVFYADEEAKKCYGEQCVVEAIHEHFGDKVFTEGKVDFQKMAQFVFKDYRNLVIINRLIHPRVMERFDAWAKEQQAPSVMMESAILFENGLDKFFDLVIVVDAPLDVRIERIKKRNPALTEQEIRDRIEAQMPQEEKCKRADMVIDNRG
ncbi:MAG: dephospho-CoA kinase [Bacteroidales bacterium]|nr:dephospho-CoA kinase [Bacteroidales bacterium]